MVSEFGSALNERSELDCFTSITDYFTSSGLANDGRHAPIQSWFYWCAATPAHLWQRSCVWQLQCPWLSHCLSDLCLPKVLIWCLASWIHKATALSWPCLYATVGPQSNDVIAAMPLLL